MREIFGLTELETNLQICGQMDNSGTLRMSDHLKDISYAVFNKQKKSPIDGQLHILGKRKSTKLD
jgi:hypothetical protein